MKARVFVALLLAAAAFGQALSSTNGSPAASNHLAFYLVAEKVPRGPLIDGTATPEGLKLEPQPILSDPDFVGWDLTNHTFTITPAAAIGLGVQCDGLEHEFVLMAEGVPIYLSGFWTSFSSSSCGVPVIMTDCVALECFIMDKRLFKIPDDLLNAVGKHLPADLEGLMALTKTYPTTNVTLRIDTRYGPSSAEAVRTTEGRRSDPRVAAAVRKMFPGRESAR